LGHRVCLRKVLRPYRGLADAPEHGRRASGAPEGGPLMVWAAGRYIDWGVVSISLTNLLVIVGMIVIFVLALVIPFPREHVREHEHEDDS